MIITDPSRSIATSLNWPVLYIKLIDFEKFISSMGSSISKGILLKTMETLAN